LGDGPFGVRAQAQEGQRQHDGQLRLESRPDLLTTDSLICDVKSQIPDEAPSSFNQCFIAQSASL
jgi:hypothetical protein